METVEIAVDDAINEFEERVSKFSDSQAYYEAQERDLAIGIATPPQLRDLLSLVGLPRIYVNSIADRLIVEGFRIGDESEADEDIWAWWRANALDTGLHAAFIDALVYGRSYITIAAPGEQDAENPLLIPDVPIIRVESPLALFAHKDPRTNEVDWAVRVVKDEDGSVVAATMYYPDRTEIFMAEEGEDLKSVETIRHGLGVVPVVDITHRASLIDSYGSSAITSEIRSITDAMSRMMMNMQVTSELMATPQRMLFGTTIDEINPDGRSGLELYTASYLTVEDPNAKAIQLPAAELRNFTEAIQHMMRMAAAYTGLPPQYLSFTSDNPASAEAIRSAETRLVRTCESIGSMFGDALERAVRIALLVMGTKLTLDHFRMETVWRDPATPTYQAKADATTKAYNSGNGIIPLEQARIDMGYTPEQRRQMREWDKEAPAYRMHDLYGSMPDPEVTEDESEPVGAEPEE